MWHNELVVYDEGHASPGIDAVAANIQYGLDYDLIGFHYNARSPHFSTFTTRGNREDLISTSVMLRRISIEMSHVLCQRHS